MYVKWVLWIIIFLFIGLANVRCVHTAEHTADVLITWTAPTMNEDGTALEDLAGFKISYRQATEEKATIIDVGNVGAYVLKLLEGVQYFITCFAYDDDGNAGEPAKEISVFFPVLPGNPGSVGMIIQGRAYGMGDGKQPENKEVTRVIVTELIPSKFQVDLFKAGIKVYTDEEETFSEIPNTFEYFKYIRPMNKLKYDHEPDRVHFDIDKLATLYVGYDARVLRYPHWLAQYVRHRKTLTTKRTSYTLWYRLVQPGRVHIPANLAGNARIPAKRLHDPAQIAHYIILLGDAYSIHEKGGNA